MYVGAYEEVCTIRVGAYLSLQMRHSRLQRPLVPLGALQPLPRLLHPPPQTYRSRRRHLALSLPLRLVLRDYHLVPTHLTLCRTQTSMQVGRQTRSGFLASSVLVNGRPHVF